MSKRRTWRNSLRVLAAAGVLVSTMSIAALHCPQQSGSMRARAALAVDDSDLDLSMPSELFTLYQRLQDAARLLVDGKPERAERFQKLFSVE